jgi:hypothetical protein
VSGVERCDPRESAAMVAFISSGEISPEWAMRYLFPETTAAMYSAENQWAGHPHANSDAIAPGTVIQNLELLASPSSGHPERGGVTAQPSCARLGTLLEDGDGQL